MAFSFLLTSLVLFRRWQKREIIAWIAWLCGQVAVLTGAPVPHQMGPNFPNANETSIDEGPPTPGDDDDDDDDKDKVRKEQKMKITSFNVLLL